MIVYESYTSGSDSQIGVYASQKCAQTFTPSSSHSIDYISLNMYREGTVGTIYAEVWNTSAGVPTSKIGVTSDGVPLSQLGTDNNSWITFSFSSPISVVSGTQYAIVIYGTGFDGSNRPFWREDATSPTYSGGNVLVYVSSWNNVPTEDFLFMVLGKDIVSGNLFFCMG